MIGLATANENAAHLTALLRALPIWTLRIVVPPHLPGMAERARLAVQYQGLLIPVPRTIPHSSGNIPHQWSAASWMTPILQIGPRALRGMTLARSIPDVIRATALFIVMTIAGTPTVGVLCKAWCDPLPAAVSGCHATDTNSASQMAPTDDCDEVGLDPALAPEYGRLLSLASDGGDRIAHSLGAPRSCLRMPAGPHCQRQIPTRPQSTTLRI